jgi:hypothetical protein
MLSRTIATLGAVVALAGTARAVEPTPTTASPAPSGSAVPAMVKRKYAMRQTFTSQMRNPNPMSGKEWASTHTHTWSVVDWVQIGTKVEYRERVCGVATEKVFGASTIYRDAFVKATPVRALTASLVGSGPGATFEAGPYPQQMGVRLKDPYNEPLPNAKGDPRLTDDDRDGKPGVTVVIHHPMVGTGEVYVAQATVVRMTGKLQDDGTIRGQIRTSPNMFKIDADQWWLRGESPQRPHPDPAMSPFVLVPAGDDLDCAKLMATKDAVFAKIPTLK